MLLMRHYRLEEPYYDYSALTLKELDELATGSVSPNIKPFEQSLFLDSDITAILESADMFICSDAVRTQQTCQSIMDKLCLNKTIEIDDSLNEIYFKPSQMMTCGNETPLETVRRSLYPCIFEGCDAVESMQSIELRLDKILDSYRQSNAVLFTHGFLMRLMKSYISCDKGINKALETIDNIRPIDYLESIHYVV